MASETQDRELAGTQTARTPAQERAARQWHRLWNTILTITPRGIARFVLLVGGIYALIWLVKESWPAPLPFVVGGAIAYIMLPVVNTLERAMPRALAAIISVVLVVALLVGTLALLVRVVALELYNAYEALPQGDEVESIVSDVDQYLTSLPDPVEVFVRDQIRDSINETRDRIKNRVDSINHPVRTVVLGLINAIGLVLGLLVLPVWLLLVLRDQRHAVESINKMLPDWLEGDFWGVARILNRAMGAYLRGLVVVGLAVGAVTAAGLIVMDEAGVDGIRYPIALGLLTAFLELVPVVGPIIAATAVVGITAVHEPQTGVAVLALIVLIRLFVRNRLASRLERRIVDIHPAILLVAIAALSQFGLIWTLLAAPIAVVGRDLFRYTWGRLADPPVPAGVLPGERALFRAQQQQMNAVPARRVPLVYQRTRAQ
jgi:predicted PurR-regulated permease PerM